MRWLDRFVLHAAGHYEQGVTLSSQDDSQRTAVSLPVGAAAIRALRGRVIRSTIAAFVVFAAGLVVVGWQRSVMVRPGPFTHLSSYSCVDVALCRCWWWLGLSDDPINTFEMRGVEMWKTLRSVPARLATIHQAIVGFLRISWVTAAALLLYHRFAFPITIRKQLPQCRNCGYILHGLTEPRCPECGFPI